MKNRSISFFFYSRILLISKIQSILSHIKLIHQIALGLVLGILLAVTLPQTVPFLTVFGDLFVKALKSVAPVLVFFLVINAIAQKKPYYAVFRDSSFTSSPEKINVFEIFKLLAPNTNVRVI